MSDFVKNLLTQQRQRTVASIMRHLEAEVYPKLEPPQRKALRDKVLSSVGSYHDVCLDMVKASVNDGSISNEIAEELRAELSGIRGALNRLPV